MPTIAGNKSHHARADLLGSERAPGPVLRHAACDWVGALRTHVLRQDISSLRHAFGSGHNAGSAVGILFVGVLVTNASGIVPLLVLPIATVAGTRLYAVRMKFCVLVERNSVVRMLGAEDVAAVPAVVLPDE